MPKPGARMGDKAAAAVRTQLEAAGVKHEVVVYPGAPHSFFDRAYEQYANESADAWTRCLEFIRANSK